jgi:hypothetical protein
MTSALISGLLSGIIFCLLAYIYTHRKQPQGTQLSRKNKQALERNSAIIQAPGVGQAAVAEFGYPMPSTTQPASVAPVSGYATQTTNPDSAYANKRSWEPDGESYGMGV